MIGGTLLYLIVVLAFLLTDIDPDGNTWIYNGYLKMRREFGIIGGVISVLMFFVFAAAVFPLILLIRILSLFRS